MTVRKREPEARKHRTLVLGLLGGIASGKSEVARLLAGPDGVVLDADRLAHAVLASDAVTARVRARFGPAALGPDGRPDRAALARLVFGDPEALKALEDFTHPPVRAMIRARLEEARQAGVPRVVLDVPLLLEHDERSQLAGLCDALVFVDSDDGERARRAAARGWAPGELSRREAVQLPLSEKRARADLVIENRGSLSDLEAEVDAALRRLGADRTSDEL
jgi:dephospho-CoA kinase